MNYDIVCGYPPRHLSSKFCISLTFLIMRDIQNASLIFLSWMLVCIHDKYTHSQNSSRITLKIFTIIYVSSDQEQAYLISANPCFFYFFLKEKLHEYTCDEQKAFTPGKD